MKEKIKTSKLQAYIWPEIKNNKYPHTMVKENLYADPDGYIEFLRNGSD